MVHLPSRLVVAAATLTCSAYTAATAAGVANVEDLNFADLADAVQAHPFLAVAFYSPGCGRCRRLLPSWTQAAQLLKDQHLPISLARMDVSSRGGMQAWKAFGLSRLPAVKVFVGNDPDEPLLYAGHLDASGIAAHLAMLERDRRRLLQHQEKYGGPANKSRRDKSGGDANDASPAELSSHELAKSSVTLVTLSELSPKPAADTDTSRRLSAQTISLSDRFREAVGREGVSLVLFVPDQSPKARRMIVEIEKAAPILAENDPPTKVIVVDLNTPESRGSTQGKSHGARAPASLDPTSAKGQLGMEFGVSIGNGPELRIFLDGFLWVDGGVFRGMPTVDGILQHMKWVALEAGLRPQNERLKKGVQEDRGSTASDDFTAASCCVENGECVTCRTY